MRGYFIAAPLINRLEVLTLHEVPNFSHAPEIQRKEIELEFMLLIFKIAKRHVTLNATEIFAVLYHNVGIARAAYTIHRSGQIILIHRNQLRIGNEF